MKWMLALLALSLLAEAQIPSSKNVWIITEENHSYEEVIGNPEMPYFNSLASQYSVAAQYYSPQHSSLTALMWLVAGQQVTDNNATTNCFSNNNLVRQLLHRGYTWRSYQEDLPYAGFEGLYAGYYLRRHNPLIDFSDSCAPAQVDNSVPYTQLQNDIQEGTLPQLAYITPDTLDDAHDGTLAEADAWLAKHVPVILNLPAFQPGGDGLLFVVWDEGGLGDTDNRCSARLSSGCGGRVATLVIGPQVRRGYQSQVLYTHMNVLRTICDGMSLVDCPRAGALANPMVDFFNRVQVISPVANAVVSSPVRVQAQAVNDSRVYAMQVYVDNALRYQAMSSSIDTKVSMAPGRHNLVVQSWDINGGIHKASHEIEIKTGDIAKFPSEAASSSTHNQAVSITMPANGASLPSPVEVRGIATDSTPVSAVQIYIDDQLRYEMNGFGVDFPLNLSGGDHKVTVQAWNAKGQTYKQNVDVKVLPINIAVASPKDGKVHSPVAVSATAQSARVVAMQLYVDNVLQFECSGATLRTSLNLAAGTHQLVLQAWDENGGVWKKAINVDSE